MSLSKGQKRTQDLPCTDDDFLLGTYKVNTIFVLEFYTAGCHFIPGWACVRNDEFACLHIVKNLEIRLSIWMEVTLF